MYTQDTTDFSDPRQRFLWAFRGMQFNGVTFLAPEVVFQDWSEHLTKAGFIHVSQLEELADEYGNVSLFNFPFQQEIHYQPPVEGQDHMLNAGGKWIPIEEPVMESRVSALQRLTPQEQAQLVDEMREAGLIGE